ncbi:gliding motility-associated C-terminal domain-containing protein [Arthrospiribacter ruber]|uniref:PKD domain-containing protein n=1 Tax=Arthrospiribacter ruber TaxID=2487934 RepID=A0A951IX18_9BACT|nr:gliding motility-associated C-terminal domain-containing protein [Arthrospiribacter ruber]MBW3467569.1 PKD domain-containing protein [Arthrospiribacter ruber]
MKPQNLHLPTFMLLLMSIWAMFFVEETMAQEKGDNQNVLSTLRTENVPSGKISVKISGKLALCSHEDRGHIILDVNGGTAPYTFRWNNNDTVQNRYNLLSGTYTVFIKDKDGREHTERIVIQPPFPLIAELVSKKDATCGSSADGSAKIEIKFGRGEPYAIDWSHGLKDKLEADDLLPGTYTVTVADQFHCETSITFVIGGGSDAIDASANIDHIDCFNEKGAIKLNVKGGSGNYSFEWSNGQTSKDLTGLNAGVYEVLIKDNEGCSVFQSFEVFAEPSDLEVMVNRVQHNFCGGSEDGEIDLGITGGSAPYNIEWSNGDKGASINGLKAGTYTAKITDASGCTVSQSIQIEEPQKLTARLQSTVEMDCASGESSATVWVKIEGGKAPYSINWSEGSKDIQEIEVRNVQEVKVEVVDADGCRVEERVRINSFDVNSNSRVDFQVRKLQINSLEEVFTSEPLLFESEISEDFIAWEWEFGDGKVSSDKDPVHIFNEAGSYEVTLKAYDIYGCFAVETKSVNVVELEEWVTVPTAFTPNGDGLNDEFKPVLKGVNNFQMNVFNNWGEQMFAASGLEFQGWDGTYKGKLLPRGSYVYQISYTTFQGDKMQKTGTVTLIR